MEKGLLIEAWNWLDEISRFAKEPKPDPKGIEENRKNGVLFIGGERGAGKTSFLLTFLKGLLEDADSGRFRPPDREPRHVHVLLPILDFDPLPRGMPLHGWLLEPWREMARKLTDKHGFSARDDLVELWCAVFERAVVGWTETNTARNSVVEKSIAYQEMAAGWIDTKTEWYKFINAAVCTAWVCRKMECKADHPVVFVIAIDDIDLQVEQVPQLVHALRLFHHPNVAYVLTGNYDHLEHVVEMNYLSRHLERHVHLDKDYDGKVLNDTRRFAHKLRIAFLEKALPRSNVLEITALDAPSLLGLVVETGPSGAVTHVRDVLKDTASRDVLERPELGSRELVYARRAQHAIDTRISRQAGEKSAALSADDELRFMGDVLDFRLQDNTFIANGRLTTRAGRLVHSWESDGCRIVLLEPVVSLEEGFQRIAADAERIRSNAAFVLQLCVELTRTFKSDLVWQPDVGVIATETPWPSDLYGPLDRAIFYWPWYDRPTAKSILESDELIQALKETEPGTNLEDGKLSGGIAVRWLATTLNWDRPAGETHFDDLVARLDQKVLEYEAKVTSVRMNARVIDPQEEARRWCKEMLVMTAPYYGLPLTVATKLRDTLAASAFKPSKTEVEKEQERAIRDAIYRGRVDPLRRRSARTEPKPDELGRAYETFVKYSRDRWRDHPWWLWLDGLAL